MTRSQPIRALPTPLAVFLSALLCSPVLQAHPELEPTAQGAIQGFIQLDIRHLNTAATTSASLPLAGIVPLRQDDWLYGRSGFGMRSNWQAIDAEASWAYSDQEQKLLADHVRVGWQMQPQLRIDLGRMNPLPAQQPTAWPVADLLMQGVLGDDHWHADGAILQSGTATQRIRLGAFAAPAYAGGQSQDASDVALWSLGFNTTYADVSLSAAALHVPNLIRESRESTQETGDTPQLHTHDTEISACGRSLTCVDGNANLLWLGSRWQPSGSPWLIAGYGLWRQERGQLNGVNGLVEYQGNLYGGLLDVGYQWTDRLNSTLRAESLIIQHQVKGLNATIVARDAGLLDNEVTPQRVGLLLSYQLLPRLAQQLTLNTALIYDQTRPKSELIGSIGFVWRAEQRLNQY